MGKRIAMASAAFIAVCLMGVIIGGAGGATWGNPDTGMLSFLVFIFAIFAFVTVLFGPTP